MGKLIGALALLGAALAGAILAAWAAGSRTRGWAEAVVYEGIVWMVENLRITRLRPRA